MGSFCWNTFTKAGQNVSRRIDFTRSSALETSCRSSPCKACWCRYSGHFTSFLPILKIIQNFPFGHSLYSNFLSNTASFHVTCVAPFSIRITTVCITYENEHTSLKIQSHLLTKMILPQHASQLVNHSILLLRAYTFSCRACIQMMFIDETSQDCENMVPPDILVALSLKGNEWQVVPESGQVLGNLTSVLQRTSKSELISIEAAKQELLSVDLAFAHFVLILCKDDKVL